MLAAIDRTTRPAADVAALLLGHDLWIEPLRSFRDRCRRKRLSLPPLWRFTRGTSANWDARLWLATPLEGRVLRTRAGSLTRRIERSLDAATLEMEVRTFAIGVRALSERGLLSGSKPSVLQPVTKESALRTDLCLVEVIAHWLRMLAHKEFVLQTSSRNELDVCGYAGGCEDCRARWGHARCAQETVPPFHPGCRCFAQPRFVASRRPAAQ